MVGARKALWNVSAFFFRILLVNFNHCSTSLLSDSLFQDVLNAFMLLVIRLNLDFPTVIMLLTFLSPYIFLPYFLYIYILLICIVICSLIHCSSEQQNHAYLSTILLIDILLLCSVLPLWHYI